MSFELVINFKVLLTEFFAINSLVTTWTFAKRVFILASAVNFINTSATI